jgi:hypothetical protein
MNLVVALLFFTWEGFGQDPLIREVIEKQPLKDYRIDNLKLRFYANAQQTESKDFIDFRFVKQMAVTNLTVVTGSVRLFKNSGCATPAQIKELIEKELASYQDGKVTNLRTLNSGNDFWGEAPVVLQAEITAGPNKYWRTYFAYASAKQLVFFDLVHTQDVSPDYYKQFTAKWYDYSEEIEFLDADVYMPPRFAAEQIENTIIIKRCDVLDKNTPYVSIENYSTLNDDIFNINDWTAEKLYNELTTKLKNDKGFQNIRLLGKQTITTSPKPDEAYAIRYTKLPDNEGYYVEVEELLIQSGNHVFRFRVIYPKKSLTVTEQETAFFTRMREMAYATNTF